MGLSEVIASILCFFSLKAQCKFYIIKEDSLASTNQPTWCIKVVSTSQFLPNLVGPNLGR
jgi:hypothetical protein